MIPNNDPLVLLAELVKHPDALTDVRKIASLYYPTPYQKGQADTEPPDPRQVAIRLPQVKPQGIEDILNLLLTQIQHLEERLNDVKERLNDVENNRENDRREKRHLQDRILELESEPDPYSEDNCSMADSLEREYTKERLRS
ncbi:hypothetical protein BCD67_14975 [Oscillatoriales cyanobacterium USR001]|nr:hypothetical protein BCD67_14975 [Oscillatoriales cyanobacterium USR001]